MHDIPGQRTEISRRALALSARAEGTSLALGMTSKAEGGLAAVLYFSTPSKPRWPQDH